MGMRIAKKVLPFQKYPVGFWVADLAVIFLVLLVVFGIAHFLSVSNAPYIAESPIDTSLSSLPSYAVLSLMRSLFSLALSYVVAIVFGSLAAKKASYERILIPALDVLQCLPVVSFMPGLIFALTTLFPNSRWGLELACILMIFTGQAWNLVFAFYESQCALSKDLVDVTKIAKLGTFRRFVMVDLPSGIRPLVYNGMMSMAGGWFFLTVCEAFPLGDRNFRLPGLGSYMKLAFEQQKTSSFVAGLVLMAVMIVVVDFVLWRPLIAWSSRYRDESSEEESSAFLNLLEKAEVMPTLSRALDWIKERLSKLFGSPKASVSLLDGQSAWVHRSVHLWHTLPTSSWRELPVISWIVTFGLGALAFYILSSIPAIASTVGQVSQGDWLRIIRALFITGGRVIGVLLISSLWTVPIAVWIGKSPRVAKIMQPIVQDIAAFPAPMVFPLLAMMMTHRGYNPHLIALILMIIGNQWYLFFNVISGASSIPEELKLVSRAYQFTMWQRWRYLYYPAIFPSLVTGWLTAAGGSWNASIVAEFVSFPGGESQANGIGWELIRASTRGDNVTLAAAVCVLTIAIIVLNRTIWRSLHLYAEKMKLQ